MSEEIEWGPFVEHDGSGAPDLEGCFVHIVYEDSVYVGWIWKGDETSAAGWTRFPCDITTGYLTSWDWSAPGHCYRALRYRVRKSDAVKKMRERVEELTPNVTREGVSAA